MDAIELRTEPVNNEDDDAEWFKAAYEQFMRDDAPEDAVYDAY